MFLWLMCKKVVENGNITFVTDIKTNSSTNTCICRLILVIASQSKIIHNIDRKKKKKG